MPLPSDLTGQGDLFMLRVRGDSMIELGIFDGDFIVAKKEKSVNEGDIVVAGIPNDEATIKTFSRDGSEILLIPANSSMETMRFSESEVSVYGKVVTVLRTL